MEHECVLCASSSQYDFAIVVGQFRLVLSSFFYYIQRYFNIEAVHKYIFSRVNINSEMCIFLDGIFKVSIVVNEVA